MKASKKAHFHARLSVLFPSLFVWIFGYKKHYGFLLVFSRFYIEFPRGSLSNDNEVRVKKGLGSKFV